MAAPWNTIQIGFRGGVDQKTVSEFVDPESRLLSVTNGVFTHDGAVEKRAGMQALGTVTQSNWVQTFVSTLGNVRACFSQGSQLLATDGDGLFAYSPHLGQWSSVATNSFPAFGAISDRVPACVATRAPMQTGEGTSTVNHSGPTELGVAEGSGLRVVTWRDTSGDLAINASIYDLATGAPIGMAVQVASSTAANPIPMIVGGFIYIFYSDATHIYCLQLSTVDLSIASSGAIVSDALNNVYDATPYSGGTGILVCYNQSGHAGQVRYLRLESLPAVTITASGLTTAMPGDGTLADVISCRCDVTLGVAYIAWESLNTHLGIVAYNVPAWTQLNLNASSNPFQPAGIPGYTQGGAQKAGFINIEPLNSNLFLVQCIWGHAGGAYPGQAVYVASTGVLTQSVTYTNCYVAGRCSRVTTAGFARLYVPMCFNEALGTQNFSTIYLMDTRGYEQPAGLGAACFPRIVATLAPRQASVNYYSSTLQASGVYRPPILTNIGQPTAGTYRLPFVMNASEEWATTATPQPVLVQLATLNFSPSWSYTEGSGETYLAAGAPMMFAGQGCNEIGFHLWPTSAVPTGAVGGSLTTGATYGYAFVFSEVDAAGLIHRSAPSLASFTLTGGNTQVTWTIPVIPYTQRTTVVVEVYRTAAGGSIYYYVGQVTAYGNPGSTVTYLDQASDVAISSNALLYTTGGVVPSVCPPSFRQVIRHVERLWGIDDSGYVIWYSTPLPSPGTGGDAPWFNEALTLTFSDEVLTAIQSMDDKLVVYSSNHIWYVEGQGPNNLGQGSDLTVAVLLPSDVGCADPRSVVAFPGGQFFQAPSGGIYLLDRGLNVSFIGKEVQDWTQGTTVVSAQCVALANQIRFVLAGGTVLTYDYVLGRWARNLLSASVFGFPISAAMVGNVWSAACSLGMVAQEKSTASDAPGCFMDSTAAGVTTFVQTQITMAHVKPGGLDGWAQLGEVQGRADWLDPADIQMSLTFDYSAATQGPKTFTYQTLHGANPSQASWRLWPQAANTMASAVQVTLSDASPVGLLPITGQGVRWLGIAIDYTPLGTRNLNLSAAQKQ